MPNPLPPAPQDINALSREAWDALRDKVNRADNLSAVPPLNMVQGPNGPMLSVTKIPVFRPGLIVCPPDGEGPLDPPMCWVKIARVSNQDPDPKSLVTYDPWPPGSDFDFTVAAVSMGAYHCGDPEMFKPGTPVLLFRQPDLGNPPLPRYMFIYAEQAKCLPPCPPSSSSSSGGSSGSGGCCPCYQIRLSGDPTAAPITLNTSGPESYASADGLSFIQRNAATDNWILVTQTSEDPKSQSIFTADGSSPCPPTDASKWTKQSGDAVIPTPDVATFIECCPPPSSGGSSGGGSGGSGGCAEVILAGSLSFTLDPATCEITPSYRTVYVQPCPGTTGRTFTNGVPG